MDFISKKKKKKKKWPCHLILYDLTYLVEISHVCILKFVSFYGFWLTTAEQASTDLVVYQIQPLQFQHCSIMVMVVVSCC